MHTPTLWWPGDHRAGDLMSDAALLRSLLHVESAWSAVLVEIGVAPPESEIALDLLVSCAEGTIDPAALAEAAETGGNPVIPLVAALREALPEPAATWLHRGLTSQDVVDTAIQLCARDAVTRALTEVRHQVETLAALTATHRQTAMVARTLTQPALPTTFGAKAATWLAGVLDAADDLAGLRFPAQLGGAAGTLAALVELGGVEAARAARRAFPAALDLSASAPWHTRRAPITRAGDACAHAAGAWGRIANDVLALGRPEIAEVADGSGGGSSTMPHKANPTLATLVKRHALATPPLAAALHTAAGAQVDERADGGWHAEWAPFALLLRRTTVAAAQTSDLVSNLRVDADAMTRRLAASSEALAAEQRTMAKLAGHPPYDGYLGLADDLMAETLARADDFLRATAPIAPPQERHR